MRMIHRRARAAGKPATVYVLERVNLQWDSEELNSTKVLGAFSALSLAKSFAEREHGEPMMWDTYNTAMGMKDGITFEYFVASFVVEYLDIFGHLRTTGR